MGAPLPPSGVLTPQIPPPKIQSAIYDLSATLDSTSRSWRSRCLRAGYFREGHAGCLYRRSRRRSERSRPGDRRRAVAPGAAIFTTGVCPRHVLFLMLRPSPCLGIQTKTASGSVVGALSTLTRCVSTAAVRFSGARGNFEGAILRVSRILLPSRSLRVRIR